MSEILYKYRYYCETEAALVYEWRDDTEDAPTQCKNDASHVIDADSVTIVLTIDTEEHPKVDEERDRAMKVKLQFHRNGQTFKCEGAGVRLNMSTAPERVTDYTPRNNSVTLTAQAVSAQADLAVSSVKGFSLFQQVTIDRGGVAETGYIASIDVANNVITLAANLSNTYDIGVTVDADQVEVYKDGDDTIIDYWVTGQNEVTDLAGADFQAGLSMIDEDYGWANGDQIHAEVRVPYASKTFQAQGSTVNGGAFCDRMPMCKTIKPMPNDSRESATALSPDYIVRIRFSSGETTPTEKYAVFKLETWRA